MNIRGVKKSAATLGLVVVIILVGFALGVAQDRAPAGLGYLFGLHPSVPERTACLGNYAVRLGLAPKSGDSSIASLGTWNEAVILRPPLPAPNLLLIFAVAKPRKIALHLFDSVLLI